MPVKKGKSSKKIIGILSVLMVAAAVFLIITLWKNEKETLVIKGAIEKVPPPGKSMPVTIPRETEPKKAFPVQGGSIVTSEGEAEKVPPPGKSMPVTAPRETNPEGAAPVQNESVVISEGEAEKPPLPRKSRPVIVSKKITSKYLFPQKTKETLTSKRIIDYTQLNTDQRLKRLMQKRKERFGFDKGIDMIIKPDESIKIGEITVSMKEILNKIRLKEGDIIAEDLMLKVRPKGTPENWEEILAKLKTAQPQNGIDQTLQIYRKYQAVSKEIKDRKEHLKAEGISTTALIHKEIKALQLKRDNLEDELKERLGLQERIDAYGIYVVRPKDNIWNIHFTFLKDYLKHKGIILSPSSDEPDAKGFSSGVGRILKFSEHMVYIYNVREHKLDVDLNLLEPLSKIVIFNMGEVFSLLNQVDYSHINQIRFDGETIWIPAEQ